jgi:rod shape-determining protein MreC
VAFAIVLGLSLLLLIVSQWPPVVAVQTAGARAVAPLQEAVHAVSEAVGGLVDTVGDIGRLRGDNERLTSDLAGARARIATLDGVAAENAQLRALLGIAAALPMEFQPARVVARDPTSGVWEVAIAAGTADGIRIGMPVLASASGPGALAGVVVAADRQRSTVRLVVDTRSRVIAEDLETGALGLVEGQPGGQLVMRQVELADTVAVGDTVVTAGLAAEGAAPEYPRGVLIGTVTATEPDANGLTQTIFIAPATDPRHLSWLLVVTGFSSD